MREIYRSRTPIEVEGRRGFADVWTTDRQRADERAAATEGAFVEALTEADVAKLAPAAQLKARAAWANAFPDAD